MIYYDDVTKRKHKITYSKLAAIPNPPYRFLTIQVLDLEKQIHCLIW